MQFRFVPTEVLCDLRTAPHGSQFNGLLGGSHHGFLSRLFDFPVFQWEFYSVSTEVKVVTHACLYV